MTEGIPLGRHIHDVLSPESGASTGGVAPADVKEAGVAEADNKPLHSGLRSGRDIGVALSGGGVRAALFALGALIALQDTGVSQRVTTIASVSGGSILNMGVAQGCDFCSTDRGGFDECAEALGKALSGRGVMLGLAFLRTLLRRAGGRTAGLVGIAAAIIAAEHKSIERIRIHPTAWWALGGGLALIFLGLLVVIFRGALQEATYASWLSALPPKKRIDKLRDLPERSTTHVLVATDLVSGDPMYLSRSFVACPAFGWGEPADTLTATAVYASAAFPIAFPPRRVRRTKFRFQDGQEPPPYPRHMKLSDGGVHNNLGTDWFDEIERQSQSRIWKFGNVPAAIAKPVGRLIVVNAGAGGGGLHRVLPAMLSIRRIMSILYDNTVQPRLQTMREKLDFDIDAPIVVDIAESPYHAARRMADAASDDAPPGTTVSGELSQVLRGRHERAARLVRLLYGPGRDDDYWTKFARQTSQTKTKLTRAGVEAGARMMMHGYLSTVVSLHVIEGAELPLTFRDEGYFLDLAGRPAGRPTSSAAGGSKEAPIPVGDVTAQVSTDAAPAAEQLVSQDGDGAVPANPDVDPVAAP